jgi:guanine deaminase
VAYIRDAFVSVVDGKFESITRYTGQDIDDDLRPGLLTPGFVDAHLHFPQTNIIGAAYGPLLEWLDQAVFPEERRFAEPEHASRVAERFVERMAAAGTTLGMAYGSSHPVACDLLFAEASRRGTRLIAGPVLMDRDCPEDLRLASDLVFPALENLVDAWHGHDDRLEVAVLPRFALACTEELMYEAGRFAQRHGLWLSTHIAETEEECRRVAERFSGRGYLQVYEDAGVFGGRVALAHCVQLQPQEWARLEKLGATVVHCPDSNAFLGSGSMPIVEPILRGLPTAMGTDVAAGRSFSVLNTLSHAHDNALRSGRRVSMGRLFWWGTRGGAESLGHPELGMIEEGQGADMVLHAMQEGVEGAEASLRSLLFDRDATRVLRTWVAGRQVYRAS